jgi:mannose-6-phosphate isomerase-like protein (cupin superfamily)
MNTETTVISLMPPEAAQGWKLELFETPEQIGSHYHKIQRHFIVVMEGEMEVSCNGAEPLVLGSGEFVQIDPGTVHALNPLGFARFFSFALPGFVFPEDVYFDVPNEMPDPWRAPQTNVLPVLEEKYYEAKVKKHSYDVYDLIPGQKTDSKWSVSLVELNDSPKHYHQIEKEIFVVVHGTLDIEIDGHFWTLRTGECVEINPGTVHRLKSHGKDPVRVLCFNFPAYNPADYHLI